MVVLPCERSISQIVSSNNFHLWIGRNLYFRIQIRKPISNRSIYLSSSLRVSHPSQRVGPCQYSARLILRLVSLKAVSIDQSVADQTRTQQEQ